MTERRIGRRWHVPVDPIEADAGDVLDYIEDGTRNRRMHKVTGRRGGKAAGVRVQLHRHEGASSRWVPMADVVACSRRRAAA